MKKKDILSNLEFVKRVLLNKTLKRRYPLVVTYISTYRCNLRCKYCNVFNNKEEEMSTDQVKRMMDEFKRMGTKRFSFNGGEPLLREDIGELINYSKKKGFLTTMFTNGALVKDNIDKIKNLDVMMLSLDGPPEIHDKQRGKGAYDNAIEAIKIAKSNGINVWTNTVITKDNLDFIPFILENAKKYNILATFQPVLEYPHASEKEKVEELKPIIKKYEETIDNLIAMKRKGYPIFHSIRYLKYIKRPDWVTNKRKCYASKLYCAVTPHGNVAPCYPIFKNQKWLNGLEVGFEKAFKNMSSFSCNGCYCILVENDFLFNLYPEVVFNTLKHF